MSVHELFPYLCVAKASEAIAFYSQAFGAVEKFRLVEPSGRVGHAEIQLGSFVVMLGEENPEYGFRVPQEGGVNSMLIHLHVEDADAMIERAVKLGATVVRPCQDQFYGERSGSIRDPFGHRWMLGHSIAAVAPEEMQRRYAAMLADKKAKSD